MNRKSRTRSRRNRRDGRWRWVTAGGIAAAVIGLIVLNLWRTGAFASPPSPSRSGDPASLLPLAPAGPPLRGGHDPALIPSATPTPWAPPANQPVPQLDLPEVEYDFGRIYARWTVSHIFPVQNRGTADLVITDLVTSCGCTTAELSSAVIPPGHRADLTVTFDADFHPVKGPVTRLVWFATNDPAHPWVEVRITGTVQR